MGAIGLVTAGVHVDRDPVPAFQFDQSLPGGFLIAPRRSAPYHAPQADGAS